jgi:hypothetical protein
MRDDAVRVVAEGLAQMRFRFGLVTAEQSRHFVIPPTQRAVRRPLQECRIDFQHTFEAFANWPAVANALAQAE